MTEEKNVRRRDAIQIVTSVLALLAAILAGIYIYREINRFKININYYDGVYFGKYTQYFVLYIIRFSIYFVSAAILALSAIFAKTSRSSRILVTVSLSCYLVFNVFSVLTTVFYYSFDDNIAVWTLASLLPIVLTLCALIFWWLKNDSFKLASAICLFILGICWLTSSITYIHFSFWFYYAAIIVICMEAYIKNYRKKHPAVEPRDTGFDPSIDAPTRTLALLDEQFRAGLISEDEYRARRADVISKL